jgi:hypothetical protein
MRTARRVAFAIALAAAAPALSASGAQRAYPSPQAAVDALFDALVSGDPRELVPVFGADVARIAPVADEAMRSRRSRRTARGSRSATRAGPIRCRSCGARTGAGAGTPRPARARSPCGASGATSSLR